MPAACADGWTPYKRRISAGTIGRNLEPAITDSVLRPRPRLADRSQCRVGIDVTGARAVSKLANRIKHVRILVFLMWASFVIAGMTPGAIGLIGRSAPRNDLCVSAMTVGTGEWSAVIARAGYAGDV